MDLEKKIGIYYTTLTKSEKKVYQAVLNNPQVILSETIQEVATAYDVSVASIQRFIKKIDYRGFPEFRLAVEEWLHEQDTEPNQHSQSKLQQIVGAYTTTLNLLSQVDIETEMDKLVADMHQTEIIKSLGIGNTALSAEQLTYSMYSEDKFIEVVDSDIKIDYLVNALKPGMLLIIFSVTGSTTTYLKLMQAAKEKQITVYLITMNQDSKLLSLTNHQFILPSTYVHNNRQTVHMVDNRTILYCFAEVISYYYSTSENKH
ncbi:hypothetical protein [Lactobacillus allii] [Lactiplantibacillus mudanjiangensis]|uniref:MurR/RpiR family transcriptional regulator n=1 Tax=Lactiplantibacillus mudanjiangensis TaxID=1296538 RepID=UPI001015A259|nr:MurR/RpiR family transcriptional regulator [Lactiplantibacillus mudanjiangensis]VDG21383.1 hypothetical protein [Lactobacillus allii] [Lactiplantibacillus mudanjiangensis]VDG31614.1 hypothetical protein [Lactobacillus allii] [Lactiplantibacillus mudanjiangensis]